MGVGLLIVGATLFLLGLLAVVLGIEAGSIRNKQGRAFLLLLLGFVCIFSATVCIFFATAPRVFLLWVTTWRA